MSRRRFNLGFMKGKGYHSFMKTIDNMLGFDSNDKAKVRLRYIELLEEHGFKAVKLAFPKVSKASVYRWKKRFDDSGRKPTSLIPKSTRPHKLRQMQEEVVENISIYIELIILILSYLSYSGIL